MTMPPKKDEHGNWTGKRPCGDYRGLNKVTVTDHYQMPTPEEIFAQLNGATIFTTLDLRWGYHQVAIDEEDCCKTAFWGHDGLYEWVVMPFRLKNAPAFFQRLMDTTLRAQYEFCRCYIDDVIIFSKSFDKHLVHLRAVFAQLPAKQIRCHPKKMRLTVLSVEYLGHFVVPNGTAPQQVKVEAIAKMAPPTNVSGLRAFLGTAGYYRRYVQNYSRIAAPLNALLQNGVVWEWKLEAQQAFETLKAKLTQAPVLRQPDFKLSFELHTDWSATGLGAVLAQKDELNSEYVIACASRSNNRMERNYSGYLGECLAAVWGVQIFRVYLYGREFMLITDHEPLEWLTTNTKLKGMHARWANILQKYDVKIKHRAGLKHMDADGLSRNPLPSDHDPTDAQMDHVSDTGDGVAISACFAMMAGQDDNVDQDEAISADLDAVQDPQVHNPPPRVVRDDADVDLPVPYNREVLQDAALMDFLQNGVYPEGASTKVKYRIWHRAQGYSYDRGGLTKITAKGKKLVPKLEQRANLICRVHQDVGHYGVKKTYSLLDPTYCWWVGMHGQVQQEVAACGVCDWIKATFEVKDAALKPLPIMGMFYRWGVDLCKIPTISKHGSKYIVVMVEHFTKWEELRAIPKKTSEYTAAALRDVLCGVLTHLLKFSPIRGRKFKVSLQSISQPSLLTTERLCATILRAKDLLNGWFKWSREQFESTASCTIDSIETSFPHGLPWAIA
jgi:hypothetical protein